MVVMRFVFRGGPQRAARIPRRPPTTTTILPPHTHNSLMVALRFLAGVLPL